MAENTSPVRAQRDFWMLERDLKSAGKYDRLIVKDDNLGVRNSHELSEARSRIRSSLDIFSESMTIPEGFPAPLLALPQAGFAPDYFAHDPYEFASTRFRAALAQPADVIQYTPVDLLAAGSAVLAQDYRLMNFLRRQSAMDFERSVYKTRFMTMRSGVAAPFYDSIDVFALRPDLVAETDVFRLEECSAVVLVTDEVAERVMRARCTGIEFTDPATLGFPLTVVRYRTATGVAQRTRWI